MTLYKVHQNFSFTWEIEADSEDEALEKMESVMDIAGVNSHDKLVRTFKEIEQVSSQ